MARATAILEWAVTKMEERYELMREAEVRDISAYNALSLEDLFQRFQPQSEEERARIPKKLPFIVFVIDELADLILTHKEVEQFIVRIAQKARAVGIHLIVATQRPQANVVTGLIKSNMPCRVSFKVASGMDSRIVLDHKGAELLLGQGDMLFLTPHSSALRRAQGTLVTDQEIRRVVNFLKTVAAPTFERTLLAIRPGGGGGEGAEGDDLGERDPLFDQAVEIIVESGRGSVSLVQRRLAIGYSRASRLVDQMGQAGILGEHKGSVARDVLITMEEWKRMKALEEAVAREGTLFEGEEDEDTSEAPEVEIVDRAREESEI
jgi:S-DNA-T family DNA segregation ATPase FtsK/SpoIIIE